MTETKELDESGWIVSTKDTLNGKPRIEGTRISVLNIYIWYFESDLSVQEICEHYCVEKEGVEAAIDYIGNNKEEIKLQKEKTEEIEKISKKLANKKLDEIIK